MDKFIPQFQILTSFLGRNKPSLYAVLFHNILYTISNIRRWPRSL